MGKGGHYLVLLEHLDGIKLSQSTAKCLGIKRVSLGATGAA